LTAAVIATRPLLSKNDGTADELPPTGAADGIHPTINPACALLSRG
jgi:hypothetical protein